MSEIASSPTNVLENTLADYWRKVLNIEQVGLDDNFFELGGSSLMAMRLITQINKELGFKLPVSTIYQVSTLRQLAQKIGNFQSKDTSPVLLLREGHGTPLFIFPPWSSYPTIFDEFVNSYHGDNPLYGILYTEDSENFPFKTLQEYARYLVSSIKKIHPHGPYALLGYSLGARTILEVGMQFQQAQDEIELLCAISHYPSFPAKGLLFNRRINDEIRILANINFRFKMKYLRYRLPYFLKLLFTGDNGIQELVIENGAQNQILEIHDVYVTNTKFKGDLILIYETSPDGVQAEYKKAQVYRNSIFKLLWKKHVTGNIIVKIVECKHIDFFKKPAVNKITEIIESQMKKNVPEEESVHYEKMADN